MILRLGTFNPAISRPLKVVTDVAKSILKKLKTAELEGHIYISEQTPVQQQVLKEPEIGQGCG